MTHMTTEAARAGRARMARLGLGVLALSAVAACNTDKLVNLTNPDIVTGEVARNTANLNELRNGAQYEFARALTGPPGNNATPGIIGISGVMTDELWYSSTFAGMQEFDARDVTTQNTNLLPVYQYLHRARNLNEQAAAAFEDVPERKNTEDQAMLTNYAAYSYLFFAETFCSGVPFSTTDLNGQLTLGPGITTAAMLDSAINRFNLAATRAAAAGSSDQQNLAAVGLGRALLAKGDYAGAAAAVKDVPTSFEYTVEYSPNTSGQYNGIYQNITSEHRSSAATSEGINGLHFFDRGPAGTNTIDPRVEVDSIAVGTNVTKSPVYQPDKYGNLDSPVVLASGIEARLIEAEAALAKGTSNAYLPTLNSLRASAGLTPLLDPVTPSARVQQFFGERAFWLYLTGHRLGDLRRMVRDYGFAQDQVFPTGQTITGASYGSDVNFPIPFQEQNNPQFANGSCIDRNP
jgi:hypothetical protein